MALNVTVVERARTTGFVTLARVKTSLGICDNNSDERLSDLIEDVSSSIERYCGRKFARERVTEHLEGHGHVTLSVARTPVIGVEEIRNLEDAISASGYSVSDPEAGFIYRQCGWDNTQPVRTWIEPEYVNQPGRQDWHVDYVGGYLMPGDDMLTTAVIASGTSFVLSDGTFPILVSGERVRIAGFENTDNNGEFTVLSRSTTVLVVDGDLVTETPSGIIAITVSVPGNEFLPRDVQRIVMNEVRDQFRAEQRDSAIKSESLGDWSTTYGGTDAKVGTSGLNPKSEQALTRWIRVM